MLPEIRITADGSHTLYRRDLDEHYHSLYGSLTESRHIFIEMGLRYRLDKGIACPIRIFEVGLGTGLNAVLTAMTGIKASYTAVEKYPVDVETIRQLHFGDSIDHDLFAKIHQAPSNKRTDILETFSILKLDKDFCSIDLPGIFDCIYMDAFAPEKQPEMWSHERLALLAEVLAPGGVLTTYCAKGSIRRDFESLGLIAERLPGPPGGKREILRVSKPY